MSGRRCRALREKFRKSYGRPPEKTSITGKVGIFAGFGRQTYAYNISEWRRVKREYKNHRAGIPWTP